MVSLPFDEVAVVVAAFEHWMKNTTAGKEYIVSIFGFDWVSGSSEHRYEVRDDYGRVTEKLRPDQIYFLQAAVARGEFLPLSQVSAVPVDKHGCDKCGILAHCTRVTKDSRGEDMHVCNNCLQYSDEPEQLSLGGGLKECEGCSAFGCDYHPSREQRKLA